MAATGRRAASASSTFDSVVSVGSLYQYFPNKEAIVFALFDRYLTTYERLFEAAVLPATSTRSCA